MTALETQFGANDILESLNPEENPGERKKIVVEGYDDSVVGKMEAGLEQMLDSYYGRSGKRFDFSYYILSLDIGAKDIEEFSLRLKKYDAKVTEWGVAGLYLSACVLRCDSSDVVLQARGFDRPLDYVGHLNEDKKIILNGDAGNSLGLRMEGGCVLVNGNVEEMFAREMRGGIINVSGEINGYVSNSFLGGTIYHKKRPIYGVQGPW